jgi:hypothetical protein
MRGWWRTNQPPSACWAGHNAKPFLERFSRQCFSRWLTEASGHGDFLVPYALQPPAGGCQNCPRGAVVSRGHFSSCPLVSLDNPLAGRMDPRAFWSSSCVTGVLYIDCQGYFFSLDCRVHVTVSVSCSSTGET